MDPVTLVLEACLWDLLDPNGKAHLRFLVLSKDKVFLGEGTVRFREMRLEKLTGRPFFADHRVRQTCWDDPRFLPENWDQRIDRNSGRVYFAYHKTKATTYIDSRYMPAGWEMRLEASGKVYFAFHATRQTSFTDPRGLPPGVSPCLDNNGRMYFQVHSTKTTSWDDPRQGQPTATLLRWKGDENRAWLENQVNLALAELNAEQVAEKNER